MFVEFRSEHAATTGNEKLLGVASARTQPIVSPILKIYPFGQIQIHLNKLALFQLQLFIRANVPVDRAEKRYIKVNVTLSRITFLFYLFSMFVFVIVKHIKWTHFENVK